MNKPEQYIETVYVIECESTDCDVKYESADLGTIEVFAEMEFEVVGIQVHCNSCAELIKEGEPQ